MLKPSDLPVGPTYFEKWKRVLRTIEFYAAARKITLCIAFPPCTNHSENEIHLFTDLTETGQISSYSSTRLSFKLMFAESEALNVNLNHCLPLSQMCSQTTSLEPEYMVNVTWNVETFKFARRPRLLREMEESASHHWILRSCEKNHPLHWIFTLHKPLGAWNSAFQGPHWDRSN